MKNLQNRYLFPDKYFIAISKKCFNCEESYFYEDYSMKSDWDGYRKCSKCSQKIISLNPAENPKPLMPNPKVKQTREYFVFL